MATSQAVVNISGEAGASGVTIYRLVTLASDGQYDATGAAGRADGVCAETVTTEGSAFPLAIPNGAIVKVEASAAISVAAQLASTATGTVVTNTNPGVNGYWVGIARTAATAAGDIIEMQFIVDRDQVA